MNLINILLSQCIINTTLIDYSAWTDNVKILNLIRNAEARYGFYKGPRGIDEFNTEKGIVLLSGMYNNRHNIDKLIVSRFGMLAEGLLTTDLLESFLLDLSSWMEQDLGFEFETSKRSSLYLSQLEVQTEADIAALGHELFNVSMQLTKMLKSYGVNSTKFDIVSLSLHFDFQNVAFPRPAVGFQFARREGKPHNSGLYFSAAPLRTEDHRSVLESLEELLLEKQSKILHLSS